MHHKEQMKSVKKMKNIIPRDRRILMRRRRKLNSKLGLVNTSLKERQSISNELLKIEQDLLKSHACSKNYQETKALASIKKNSKYFFSYVNKLSKCSSNIGPLVTDDGKFISDSKDMADLLSKQFQSVFSSPRQPTVPPNVIFPADDSVSEPCINDVSFTEEDVVDAIKELNRSSASGPDGVPAVLQKCCQHVLSKSMDSGVVPDIFKKSNITPIFKSGSRGKACNYRPVALTSHL